MSCCLAPDGGQFPAMVQRRMDQAMFFYVVSNFTEIRSSYATNPEMRDELVKQLNDFTAQYAADVGAKGYLVRPLTYGLIPDYENTFPKESIQIDKVGGFFSPTEQSAYESDDSYYLDALDLDSFYTPPMPQPTTQQEKGPGHKFMKTRPPDMNPTASDHSELNQDNKLGPV